MAYARIERKEHTSPYFGVVSGLRGLFALVIFFHHIGLCPAGGDFGVSFFFIASGFLISCGYGERVLDKSFGIKGFLKKRARKIYPFHIVCLLITIGMGYWALTLKSGTVFVLNAALLQSWIPKGDIYFSGNPVSWFLSDIMVCYLLFPYLYRMASFVVRSWDTNGIGMKIKTLLTAIISIGVYLIYIYLVPARMATGLIYIWPLARIPDFIIGIGCAVIYQKRAFGMVGSNGRILSTTLMECGAIAMSILCVWLWGLLPERFSLVCLWWLPVTLLIMTFIRPEQGWIGRLLACRVSQAMGRISFSFFLIHVLVIRGIERIWPGWTDYSIYGKSLVALIVSLVAAIIAERLLKFEWVRK